MDATTRFRDLTVAQFIGQLASGEPVPGGGSAAAIAGSLGGALVAMVSALSDGRPKYAEHQPLITKARAAGQDLADRFLALADEDAAAFAGFGVAMKMPRDTDEEKAVRAAAISDAAIAATEAPFKTVQTCAEMAGWAEALAGRSNKNASSDLEVASLMAVAAAEAAAANVYINLPSIADQALAKDLLERTKLLVDEISRTAATTRQHVRSGQARDPLPEFTA